MDHFATPGPLDNQSFKALLTTTPNGRRPSAGRALNSWAFLTLAAATGKPLPMWRQTIARRLDHLTAAGLAPVTDAEALAVLAGDLGLTDEADLIRMVWVVNRSRCQSFATASRRWQPLARDAVSRLATRAAERAPGGSRAGPR
jgi:hypothetical protein